MYWAADGNVLLWKMSFDFFLSFLGREGWTRRQARKLRLIQICSKIKNKDRYGARLYTWWCFGSESCVLKLSPRFVSNGGASLAQRGATTWWTRLYLRLFQGIWRCNVAISERVFAVRLQDGYFIYICCAIWWPFAGRAMYLWPFQSNSYFQVKICVWRYDIRCKEQKQNKTKKSIGTSSDPYLMPRNQLCTAFVTFPSFPEGGF